MTVSEQCITRTLVSGSGGKIAILAVSGRNCVKWYVKCQDIPDAYLEGKLVLTCNNVGIYQTCYWKVVRFVLNNT